MLNFPKKTLDSLKTYLLKQKKEVDKSLKGMEEDDPAKTPVLAESSEPGTDSYIADRHAKTLVLRNQLMKMNTAIKITLSKMRIGTYGKCERCGQFIETDRLLAIPTAEYCLSCSRKSSKK